MKLPNIRLLISLAVIALCSSDLPLSFRKDCVLPFCPEMYSAAHAQL